MNRWRLLQTSLLSWFLPFALSVPLVGADGIPVIPLGLFKSIMVVVGMGSGLWLMVWLLANGNVVLRFFALLFIIQSIAVPQTGIARYRQPISDRYVDISIPDSGRRIA